MKVYTEVFQQLYSAGIEGTNLKRGLKGLPKNNGASTTVRKPFQIFKFPGIDKVDFATDAWKIYASPDSEKTEHLIFAWNRDQVIKAINNVGNLHAAPDKIYSITELPMYRQNLSKLTADPNQRYLDAHVTNGEPDAEDTFPTVVAVGYQLGRVAEWKATGVLVASNVVVTSGHCFNSCSEKVGGRVFLGLSVDLPGETVKVLKATRHPNYLCKARIIRSM